MQVKYRITAILSTALLALTMTFSAAATIIPLTATIDGAQANAGAGTGSLATGSAMMWLDDSTNVFSWNIGWSGIVGTVTAAHFHGPALPAVNGGVQVPILLSSSPIMGNATINAGQATDLLNGLWYINIHTAQFGGGEIRGQVLTVPEPSLAFLLLISLSALWFRQNRRIK